MSSWWFQPTSPQSEPPWLPPDSRRNTIDLVQSCILTLILCSWTAVHPDIPPHDKQHWWIFRKLEAALGAIVWPEYFLKLAFDELWESRLICLELKKLQSTRAEERDFPDGNPMPTVQSSPEPKDIEGVSPANPSRLNPKMHCTNVEDQSLPESKDMTVVSPANPSRLVPETHCTNHQDTNLNSNGASIGKIFCRPWHNVCETWRILFPAELERGFYIEMGGYEIVPALAGAHLPDEFRGRVTARGAIELARHGLLPDVPLALINDQSKSDMLTKVLVCLQAGWMIVQCIVRVHKSFPLTLLEVHTVIHAICAFFIYCLWLKKPHDVMFTTKVPVDDEKLEELKNIDRAISRAPSGGGKVWSFKFTERWAGSTAVGLSNCRLSQSMKSPMSHTVMTDLSSFIYGGAHLAVCKGHFPSNLERVLWIAGALSIGVLPFFADIWGFLKPWFTEWYHSIPDICLCLNPCLACGGWRVLQNLGRRCFDILVVISLVWCVLARPYLLVESFASLRSLPLGSYNAVTWVSLIPHF